MVLHKELRVCSSKSSILLVEGTTVIDCGNPLDLLKKYQSDVVLSSFVKEVGVLSFSDATKLTNFEKFVTSTVADSFLMIRFKARERV